jgi:hypothetical protein
MNLETYNLTGTIIEWSKLKDIFEKYTIRIYKKMGLPSSDNTISDILATANKAVSLLRPHLKSGIISYGEFFVHMIALQTERKDVTEALQNLLGAIATCLFTHNITFINLDK